MDEVADSTRQRAWVLVRKIWGAGILIVALAWTSYAFLVPALIRSAYRGESLPWLNRVISGQDVHAVDFYLTRWSALGLNLAAYVTVLVILTIPLVFVSPSWGVRVRPGANGRLTGSPEAWMWMFGGFSVALTLYLYFVHPPAFVMFIHEDHWAEWATSFFFSGSFIFLAFAIIIDPARRKWGCALLAVACFFVAGEEFSWGQRSLEVAVPRFFVDRSIQREINVHNLATSPPSKLIGLAILVWVPGIDWARTRISRVGYWVDRIGIPLPPRSLRPLFYASAGLLFLSHVPFLVVMLTEVGELFLGVAVAAMSLHLALESAARATPPTSLTTASTGTLFGVVGFATLGFVMTVGSPNMGPYLHQFAIREYPNSGLYTQSERVFSYLAGRNDLLADTTLIEAGRIMAAAGRSEQGNAWLERGLVNALEAERLEPGAAVPTRNVMVAYSLMGRQRDADAAMRLALRKDSVRMAEATSARERKSAHWSIAITLYKAGFAEAASTEIRVACEGLSDGQLARRIDRWVEWIQKSAKVELLTGRCATGM